MERKNPEFSQNELARMLRQPEARELMARLRQLDSAALQQAVQQAMSGNTEGAKHLLTPLMQDPTVQNLTERMRDSHGGI